MLHELTFEHCEHSKDPLLSCALEGVANILAGIKDIAIVIHSPQGCSATVANAYDIHEIDFSNRKIACSRLFESDIIMGATDKLKDLVVQADATFNTEVLFVIGTCAADIIGEDLGAVCRSLNDKVKARLIPVMAGGFHGDAYAGMDLALTVLFSMIKPYLDKNREIMADQSELKSTDVALHSESTGKENHVNETKEETRLINLLVPQASLNPTWWADAAWVKKVLEKMDVKVNCMLPRNISLNELEHAGDAQYAILLNHDIGYTFADSLEAAGMKILLKDTVLPIGIENTARWLRMLGKFFGTEEKAETIIKEGELFVQDILRKRGLMIIPRYRNCRVAISADCTTGIPLVRTLFIDLEMIPELLLFRGGGPQARALLESELSDLGIHPKVVFNADGYKVKKALQAVEVDAVLGSSWEKYMAEELGVKLAFDVVSPTNRDIYIDRAYFGYEGLLNILEVVGNDWESAYRSKEILWEQFR